MSVIKLTKAMREDPAIPTADEILAVQFVLLYGVAYYTQGERESIPFYKGKKFSGESPINEMFLKIFPKFMLKKGNYGLDVEQMWIQEKQLCTDERLIERYSFIKGQGAVAHPIVPVLDENGNPKSYDGKVSMQFKKPEGAKSVFLRPQAGVIIKQSFTPKHLEKIKSIIDVKELKAAYEETYQKDLANRPKSNFQSHSFFTRGDAVTDAPSSDKIPF